MVSLPESASSGLRYVLISPARNEGQFIELTLKSVVNQTHLPSRWVIVDDGSTDDTAAIIERYAALHPWIVLVRRGRNVERSFAGKVGAFNEGYQRVANEEFDAVGSLDADISFGPTYFAFLLQKLQLDPRLGITGTPFSENGRTYNYNFSSVEHVSGACQLFRRKCFEEIGGYVPIKGGGIDTIAVLMARMKGWRTRSWTEMVCEHHRPMGTGGGSSLLSAHYKLGHTHYIEGFHPLWMILRSLKYTQNKPYVLSGVSLMLGYLKGMTVTRKRPISAEVVRFQQQDQMRRLKAIFSRAVSPSTRASQTGASSR
jgi:poly-beta-1,6-N-acetyl-D-glucosamine synthase